MSGALLLRSLRRLTRLGPAARSLRVRLTGAVVVLSSIGIAAVTAGTFLTARSILRGQVTGRLEAVAETKEGELARWVEERRGDIAFLAGLPEVASLTEAATDDPGALSVVRPLEAYLRRFAATQARFREVFLDAIPDGRVIASSSPGRRGTYELPSTYFEVGQRRVVVQEVYTSAEDGRPTITIAAPVRGADGRAVAVLVGHLDLTRLEALAEATSGLVPGAEIYLVDRVGDFVSAERFGRDPYRRGVSSRGIRRALAGASGVEAYENYADEPVLGAYRWLPDREMALLVELPEAAAFAPARRLALVTLLAGVLGVFALWLASGGLARQVTRPLEELSAAADRVAGGDFEVRVPCMGRDEIGTMAQAFNTMTARLQAAYGDLEDQVARTTAAHAQVEESRALLQGILDNSSSLIAVTDAQGHLYLANECFRELAGAVEGPLRVEPLERLLPEEAADACRQARLDALATGGAVETRFTVPGDGAPLHFVAVVFPIEGRGAAEIGLIALDHTQAHRAELERRSLERQLHQAQKLESLGLLAGGVAHDFNNLLQAILGHAALAEEGTADAEVRTHLDQVQLAAVRASELTAQLLAYAGRRSLRSETVDVNQVIGDLGELLQVSVPRSAELVLRLADPAPLIDADPAQVVQIVMNLVTNAADALVDGKGSIVVATQVVELGSDRTTEEPSVDELPPGTYARISVEDAGHGMDARTRRRVFEPFFTTKSSGRGLGLAAVMGIVKGSRGHLTIDSAVGEGTRVAVLLPAHRAAAGEGAVAEEPRAASSRSGLLGRTILVADDENGIRRFITRALEKQGARVVEASDGIQAIELFEEHADAIDAVVLDVTMPGRVGTEVLQEIRVTHPTLPVILSSGYDAADTIASVAGMDRVSFLQKPFAVRDLLERLVGLTGG